MYKQDLHIHTEFSFGDRAVLPGMTTELIAWLKHAEIVGISDHFEYLTGKRFNKYKESVKKHGFFLGTEVDGHKEAMNGVYDKIPVNKINN